MSVATERHEAENWDDDFLFQAEDSPAKPPARPRSNNPQPASQRWSAHSVTDTLAWDDEREREEAERQSSAESSIGPAAGTNARPDLSRWVEDDDDEDFGFASRRGSAVEDTVSPLPVFPH